jgi:hypothetical protein
MIAPFVLVLALTAPTEDPTAKAWAVGLASSKAEERNATIDAIEARGLAAIPLLREITATAPGDVRSRAMELIERIGCRRLLRATPVQLDQGDMTIGDAVSLLAKTSGYAIDLESAPATNRGISLDTEGSTGFFEALDRLAKGARLRHDPAPSFRVPPRSGVRVRLVEREGEMPPAAYAGPYKVAVRSLERHREVVEARPPAASVVREDFAVVLDVVAEPGILIDRNGPIRVQQAIDDQGRDLRAPSSQDAGSTATIHRQWPHEAIGMFTYHLPLKLPEDRGRTIARLRGFVPITAIVRTDELFSSPMNGIEGKTVSGGGITLRVGRASLTNNSGVLEVTIQGEPVPDFLAFAPGPRQTTQAMLHLGFNLDDHLRIEDANGIPFATTSNGTAPPAPDGIMAYRVTLLAGRATGPPVKLRYFGVAGVATEVPFEFRDLPIP